MSLQNFSVYPNPANDFLTITADNIPASEINISISNIEGKEILNETGKTVSGNYKKQINVENIAKGIYFLKLSSSYGVKIQKLIIQ